MAVQFAIGTGMIVFTVVVAVALMTVALEGFQSARDRLLRARPIVHTVAALSLVTLSMVAVLSVVMWMWAAALVGLGLFDRFEPALEMTMVSFTTLGGGTSPEAPEGWGLIPGFIGTGGFILFGLSTAFLFEAISDLRRAHRERRNGH